MLHVCICDDRADEIFTMQKLARHFAAEHPEHALRVKAFQSPYDLMEYLEKNEGFDLYLLDVIMPHMTGLELAGHIRARGEEAAILFLTTSREYAVEAFGVRASGYLVKPVGQQAFDDALLATVDAMTLRHGPSLVLKTRDGIRKVPLHTLVLVESFNHSRRCTMLDGSAVDTPETLGSLLERLQGDARFFSPHRAYIVNLEYVNGVTATEAIMINGTHVPVARKQYAALKEACLGVGF